MIRQLYAAFFLVSLSAQPIPVHPLEIGSPDQLAINLREKRTIPKSDCDKLELWECRPDDTSRSGDISIRWVQLDDDPELEALIVMQAPAENTYAAFVFDKRKSWNLVGAFFDRQWKLDASSFLEAGKLTEDSPTLLLVHRDLGGSGSALFTTEAFHLRQGQLWPALTVTNAAFSYLPAPGSVTRETLFSSGNFLIIHKNTQTLAGELVSNTCEAQRWTQARRAFVRAPEADATYCDRTTGKPFKEKSRWAGLKYYP